MRFYLRYTGASCTIVDMATHCLIGFLDMTNKKESLKTLKDLSKLSLHEYIVYCMNKGLKFRYDKSNEFIFDKELKEWCEKAWITTTKNALKELKAGDIIPNDIVTVEDVKEVVNNKPTKGNNISATKEKVEKPMNKIEKDVNNTNKPKKLSKKLKGKKDTEVSKGEEKPILGEDKGKKVLPKKKMHKKGEEKLKYTKEILRGLLATKKIDIKTYREEMKKLS